MPAPDLTTQTRHWSEGKQRVLNGHRVPARDAQRDLPDVPVRAWVVWAADDRAEVLETVAFARSGRLVLIRRTSIRTN